MKWQNSCNLQELIKKYVCTLYNDIYLEDTYIPKKINTVLIS